MLSRVIGVLSGLSVFVGFGLIVGTAGSLDLNLISLSQGIFQSLGGLLLIGGGLIGLRSTCDFEVDYE